MGAVVKGVDHERYDLCCCFPAYALLWTAGAAENKLFALIDPFSYQSIALPNFDGITLEAKGHATRRQCAVTGQ